jgi:hypothetical protein
VQAISEAIAKRNGAILSSYTILKADVYPSLYSPSLRQLIPGAPNFRQAHGNAPVFGVGISTLEGIKGQLAAVCADPSVDRPFQCCAVCTNLREEPVLYINGTPYVLREAAGAYTNMKEYSGIDGKRLELLEDRLKAEVLTEARAHGGRVHVLNEEMDVQVRTGVDFVLGHSWLQCCALPPGGWSAACSHVVRRLMCRCWGVQAPSQQCKPKGHLSNSYEQVEAACQVQTPRELYASLAAQGYCLQYSCAILLLLPDHSRQSWLTTSCVGFHSLLLMDACLHLLPQCAGHTMPEDVNAAITVPTHHFPCRRVPLTDGTTPEVSDVDRIHALLQTAPPQSCFVFNCQQGKGRTTIGMVLALLFLSAAVRSSWCSWC